MDTRPVLFYRFRTEWIADSYDAKTDKLTDETRIARGLVAAYSYAEAVEKIVRRLPYAHNIFVTEYEDVDFIFMNERYYAEFRSSEYGFEPEEKEEPEEEDNIRCPKNCSTCEHEVTEDTEDEYGSMDLDQYCEIAGTCDYYDNHNGENCPYYVNKYADLFGDRR